MKIFNRIVALSVVALTAVMIASCAASGGGETEETDCNVGEETCSCNSSGECFPGLQCLSGVCVNPNPTGTGGNGGGGGAFSTGAGMNCATGCSKLDVLFAIDHSMSMAEEISALAAVQAFTDVVNTLSNVNCGQIDFRIGLTDDNDRGFITGAGFSGSNPWFDSNELPIDAIASAFGAAANSLLSGPATPTGCEHVLTSAVNLLNNDSTGFVRPDALLVLILISDVDDYGIYDQGTVQCQLIGPQQGCTTPQTDVNNMHAQMLAIKDMDPNGLASIVVAGDPAFTEGFNICNQPASCCGAGGIDCDQAFHATRLYQWTGLMAGMNGIGGNICGGAGAVPTLVKSAFENNIDLACKGFDPPK
jgi:hypothetical protein